MDNIERLLALWQELAPDFLLGESHKVKMRVLLEEFAESEIEEAMAISIDYYVINRGESCASAWQRVGGVCRNRKFRRENPEAAQVEKLSRLLKKRFGENGRNDPSYDEDECQDLLESAQRHEVDFKVLESQAYKAEYFVEFQMFVVFQIRNDGLRLV